MSRVPSWCADGPGASQWSANWRIHIQRSGQGSGLRQEVARTSMPLAQVYQCTRLTFQAASLATKDAGRRWRAGTRNQATCRQNAADLKVTLLLSHMGACVQGYIVDRVFLWLRRGKSATVLRVSTIGAVHGFSCATRRQPTRYFSNPARSLTPRSRAHLGMAPRPEYSSPSGPRNCTATFLPAGSACSCADLPSDGAARVLFRLIRAFREGFGDPSLSSSICSSLIRFPRSPCSFLFAAAMSWLRSSKEYRERSGSLGIVTPRHQLLCQG